MSRKKQEPSDIVVPDKAYQVNKMTVKAIKCIIIEPRWYQVEIQEGPRKGNRIPMSSNELESGRLENS